MILIGLGANLSSDKFGTPLETLESCLLSFAEHALYIKARSRWFKSAPVPISDQPWYINGVVCIETKQGPRDLLKCLLRIENDYGRVRNEANSPRVLDLDLITYDDLIVEDEGELEDKPFCIPHPRMHERAFVLHPINDIDSAWKHPKSQKTLPHLISLLSSDQIIQPIDIE